MTTADEAIEKLQTQFECVEDFGRMEEQDGLRYLAIIRTELRELREECENWEVAARVAAFDDQFPEFCDVHTLKPNTLIALSNTEHVTFAELEKCWRESKQQDQEPDVIRKLSVMLVTLCRTLPKYHELRVGALEYLAEQNLMPSPLRDGGEG